MHPDVYVININSFPTPLKEKAFRQLPSFARLRMVSSLHWKASITNADREASLHDLVMHSPLGSFCGGRYGTPSTSSVFNTFRESGYETELRGVFGLDRRIDSHKPRNINADLRQDIGIDVHDRSDSAFLDCVSASERDEATLSRAARRCSNRCRDRPHFLFVNLVGCKDAEEFGIDRSSTSSNAASIYPGTGDETRFYSQSVVEDDPRASLSGAADVEALRADAAFHDLWTGGSSGVTAVSFASRMHAIAWKELSQLDVHLASLLDAIDSTPEGVRGAFVLLLASNTICLREHGAVSWGPWSSLCDSFLCIHRPGQADNSETCAPVSVGAGVPFLLSTLGLLQNLFFRPSLSGRAPCTLTLSLSPDMLSRACLVGRTPTDFRAFFVRARLEMHTLVLWFSAGLLLRTHGEECGCLRDEWENPLLGKGLRELVAEEGCDVQAFNVASDVEELDDLARDQAWLDSDLAALLKAEVDAAMRAELPQLHVRIGTDLHLADPYDSLSRRCVAMPTRQVPSCRSWVDTDAFRALQEAGVCVESVRPRAITVFLGESPPHPVYGLLTNSCVGTFRTVRDKEVRVWKDGLSTHVGAEHTVVEGPELVFRARGAVAKFRVSRNAPHVAKGAAREARKKR